MSEPGEESDSALRHLANDTEQPDTHPTDSASVLVCRRPPASSDAAHRRLAELRGHYTVLLVAVPLPDGVLVDLRNGPRFAVRPAAAEALLAPGPAAAAFSSALRAKPRPELLDHSGLLLDLGSHCRELTIQKVPEPH